MSGSKRVPPKRELNPVVPAQHLDPAAPGALPGSEPHDPRVVTWGDGASADTRTVPDLDTQRERVERPSDAQLRLQTLTPETDPSEDDPTRWDDEDFVQSKTLLVFQGPHFDIAFDALRVRELRACEDWAGGQPVALSRALGGAPAPQGSLRRVLIVETDDEQEVAVLAEGPISIQTVPGDSVVPPPPNSDYLCGVVPGARNTVLVEPDLLRNLVA